MLAECRAARPALDLAPGDVRLVHRGLLPLKRSFEPGNPDALRQHHRIVDHEAMGMPGLVIVVGVK
jgi:glycerol-3-phosphate dehydrogenase